MSENVGASTSYNPKGPHGLYRDNFNLMHVSYIIRREEGYNSIKCGDFGITCVVMQTANIVNLY
jgi:hypothetical protein